MVKWSSLLFMYLTLFIVFALPAAVCVYRHVKGEFEIKPLFVGMLIFFVFQIGMRRPLLGLIESQSWFLIFSAKYAAVTAFFIALSAGIFEEVGRYIAFRFFLKDRLSYENGINYGIGHGWIEAILFVGLVYINNVVFAMMINSGKFDSFAAASFSQTEIQSIKNQMINLAPINFALAGFERFMAMIIQVAYSLIVLYGVKKKEIKYLFYAILAHTALDFPVGIIGQTVWIWPYMGFFVAVSILYIIKSKKSFEKLDEN